MPVSMRPQYARWAGLTYPIKSQSDPYYTEQWAAKDLFWTNAAAKNYFKGHIYALLNRLVHP
jgi:hypothetical protein